MKSFFLTYLFSLILAVLITPVVIAVARYLKIYDSQTSRKVHAGQIPRIGGVAIFISSVLLVVIELFLDTATGERFRQIQTQFIALLCASTFIFLVGLADDLWKVRVRYKLLAQISAAMLVCVFGARIESLNFANLFTLRFGILSFPLTIFWIISITNAVNLIDGLDGLATGICAIACTVVAVFAFVHSNIVLTVIMLALMGSLTGFLFFNFNPARIFMGDCGSTFLGFVLGSASVMCAMKTGTIVALALPAVALGLPIFDTAFSILRRYLGRWSITSADRGHLHHRLLDMGLKQRHVVIIMYGITALSAGLGMFMMITHGSGTLVVLFSVILLLLLVFRGIGAVRLSETIAKIRYKKAISDRINKDTQLFRETYLAFQQTVTFRQWWKIACHAAENQGFSEFALTTTDNNGRRHKFYWSSDNPPDNQSEEISVQLPLSEHRFGMPVEVEAKMPISGSLEITGRRMMLLGRLIDEYSDRMMANKKERDFAAEFANEQQNEPVKETVEQYSS
ncbi:MAG: undecaprenyl/decaprenyl-phosphate alpha-N-acetylglucosaminyl 1-phosphate transferase [Sedimentisphaerales bacterium]|nr:undecaprenyl/decaprenyl-phosphate alpha-N-acetylglucosaminyl 1-phosphate transferase [Sedimentisphaerales bacterium]